MDRSKLGRLLIGAGISSATVGVVLLRKPQHAVRSIDDAYLIKEYDGSEPGEVIPIVISDGSIAITDIGNFNGWQIDGYNFIAPRGRLQRHFVKYQDGYYNKDHPCGTPCSDLSVRITCSNNPNDSVLVTVDQSLSNLRIRTATRFVKQGYRWVHPDQSKRITRVVVANLYDYYQPVNPVYLGLDYALY